jgi:hypothetical protein
MRFEVMAAVKMVFRGVDVLPPSSVLMMEAVCFLRNADTHIQPHKVS